LVSNKQFLPDSYTSFKNKIGLIDDNDHFISEKGDVELVWPYKDCVLEGGQSKDEQQRDEIFWNETLAPDQIDRLLYPKVLTNFSKYTVDGFQKLNHISLDDNLIIKGNNLLALSSIRRKYEGKIKMIYIDPPYNTSGSGDTFSYNNSFKHSTWLTFMSNRIRLAKELLTNDGFIAIAIDHVELFYLGVLVDEIFGRENRVGIVSVVHKPEGRNQEKFFATSNEFMLVYAKNKSIAKFTSVILDEEKKKEYNKSDEKGVYKLNNYLRSGGGDHNLRVNKPHFFYPIYVNPDTLEISLEYQNGLVEVLPITSSGQERTWKTKKDTFIERLNEGEIVAVKEADGTITINEKYRQGQLIKTHWIGKRYNAINNGTKVLENILGSKEFSYPKSLYTVQDIINICTNKDDIVLDFFAGSGTTAHAVLNLNKEDGGNRKFIIIEQMDYIRNVTVERIKKIIEQFGKGSFVYCELLQLNECFIDEIKASQTDEQLMNIWKKIKESDFLSYKIDINIFEENITQFKELSMINKKKFLIETLDKNMLYVNYCDIDNGDYSIDDYIKSINRQFYEGV